jgi:hypothetical protein
MRLLGHASVHVDPFATRPLPSGHTSRRWGIGIKRHDGTVPIEPEPAVVVAADVANAFLFTPVLLRCGTGAFLKQTVRAC